MPNRSFRLFSYFFGIEANAAVAVAARSKASRRGRSVAAAEALETRTLLTGLTIVPTFAPNIKSDPNAALIEAGINAAISQVDSDFSNPITVDITFQAGGSNFKLVGASGWGYNSYSYSSYRAALVSHATDGNDASAIASLPTGSKNPANGNSQVSLNDAIAAALGLRSGPITGIVKLNIPALNLTRTAINPNDYDLQAATLHEIDEVLGMNSVLPGMPPDSTPPTGPVFPDDLFRYASNGTRSYTTSASAAAYLSIDGGNSHLAHFNQTIGGDFGDWYSIDNNIVPQVQDAFEQPGGVPLYNVEPVLLDVIGYTPTRNLGTGVIEGNAFADNNGDGTQHVNGTGPADPGEPNQSGWTIKAMQNGKVVTSTVSNAAGYQLTNLPDGTYTIVEVPQTGYHLTTAASYSVTISSHNDIVTGKNFGNDPNLNLQLSSSLNNVTVQVDPGNSNDIEVLNGSSVYKTVPFNTFSVVQILGGSSISNTVTVNYGDGFYGAQVSFLGAGSKNSLSVLDEGISGTRQWNINPSSISATGPSTKPSVAFSGVQSQSLTGRSSGGETFVVTNYDLSLPSTTTTLHINTNDTVNIQGTANPLVIDGTGTSTGETVNVGSKAPGLGGTLANISAAVTVNNVTTLNLDDSGDTSARTGSISSTQTTGFGLPSASAINYNNQLAKLNVRGGSGSNTDLITSTNKTTSTNLYSGTSAASTVNVRGTSGTLVINGNGKADTINIGSLAPATGGVLGNILGSITVTNTSSESTLSLDDSGDKTSRTGTLSATRITGIGMGSTASVFYTGKQLAHLTIRGGKAGGTLTATGASTAITVTGFTVKT